MSLIDKILAESETAEPLEATGRSSGGFTCYQIANLINSAFAAAGSDQTVTHAAIYGYGRTGAINGVPYVKGEAPRYNEAEATTFAARYIKTVLTGGTTLQVTEDDSDEYDGDGIIDGQLETA